MGEGWANLGRRRVRRLLVAVEALVAARQVVLMELARQYPGARWVAAPLKALDRLLSNPQVQQARHALYAALLQRTILDGQRQLLSYFARKLLYFHSLET